MKFLYVVTFSAFCLLVLMPEMGIALQEEQTEEDRYGLFIYEGRKMHVLQCFKDYAPKCSIDKLGT